MFERLGVFTGGFTAEAAEQVCGSRALPPASVQNTLFALVEKSLVEVRRSRQGLRWHLLQTIRQYALERLAVRNATSTAGVMVADDTGGTEMSVEHRHFDYYAALVAHAESHQKGEEQSKWLDVQGAEHDNLRAALNWALNQSEFEKGLQLAGNLGWYWYTRGYHEEGARFLAAFHQKANAVPSALRLKAVQWLGNIAYGCSQFDVALRYFEEGLVLRTESGDPQRIAIGRSSVANAIGGMKQYDRALELLAENLTVFQAIGDKRNVALTLTNMGVMHYELKHYGQASKYHSEALDLFRGQRDTANIALALNNLADARLREGKITAVRPLLDECYRLCQQHGIRHRSVLCLLNYISLAIVEGDHTRAAILCGYVERYRTDIGYTPPSQTMERYHADIACIRKHLGEAQFNAMALQGEKMSEEALSDFVLHC